MSVRTVCVEAEQKNDKQTNWPRFEGSLNHRRIPKLPERKFIVVGASAACVVSHCCPIFMIFGIVQEYGRRLLVPQILLPCIVPSVEVV